MQVQRRTDLVFDESLVTLDGRDGANGERGERGLQGERGEPGERGADAKGFNWRGEYRRTASYNAGDVVSYSGSSYLALVDSKGVSPPEKKRWGLLASRGEDGEDGVSQRGPRGLKGDKGDAGSGGEGTPLAFIADENILQGMPLRVTTSGHCTLADAASFSTAEVVALAVTDTANGFAGLMQAGDSLTLEDWSAVLGSEFLTPGLAVYLALGGGLSHDAPEPAVDRCVVYVGRALTTTALLIEIGVSVVLTDPPED
jgi:hypothetical protein